MVKHLPTVNRGLGLRDQLNPSHVLTVPKRRAVERELSPLLRYRIGRVLVVCGETDVFFDGGRSVDVVLVRSDLVRPRPFV